MKGVLVIIDGMGDRPCKKLGGKTPLEAAEKPNLDYLAKNGLIGEMYPVSKSFVPGTSEAIVSIFGEDWQNYPRGGLEALGEGIELEKGDLALRANFATIDNLKDKNIIDRRAGRTLSTKEAQILAKAISHISLSNKFLFKSTLQHRGILVFKGGFSDSITEMDPAYHSLKKSETGKLRFCRALDDDENSEYTANLVNDFVEKSFNVLDKHPVNELRRKKGLLPANIILVRGGGIEVKRISKYKNWACASSVPVAKGICKAMGINLFEFGAIDFKKDINKNLRKNLLKDIKKSIKLMKRKWKKFDYFLIYLKEPDVFGHDNKPLEKKEIIELIDKKLFSSLKKYAVKYGIKIAVTADHSTPCELKQHSADPVPVLLCSGKEETKKEGLNLFSEKQAKKGRLGIFEGKMFLEKTGMN